MKQKSSPRLLFSNGQNNFQDVIWIDFADTRLLKQLKSRTAVFWNSGRLKYYIIDNVENAKLLDELRLCDTPDKVVLHIHPNNREAYFRMKDELILKGYSKNTMRTYLNEFVQLLRILKSKPVEQLSVERIKSYLVYCLETLAQSENQVHSRINALKFYFEKVLHKEKFFFDIPRPKKPSLLPKHLTEEEINKIFLSTNNCKHLLVIKLCYGMGLRVSEIVNLKLEDIYWDEFKVLIASAKGKKDRYVYLPKTIAEDVKVYIEKFSPKKFLFEGSREKQLHVRTVQVIFKNAMRKAGVDRSVGIHSLRHSYATHLLQYGTDISHIQKLLGHKDIKTTLNYTKVTDKNLANIISPLDRMNRK